MPSSASAPPIAVVSGVDHFLGLHLAYALISKHVRVIGLPLQPHQPLRLPSWLTGSPLFQIYTGYPSLSELHHFCNSMYSGSPAYLLYTDFYAHSLLPSMLSDHQRLKLLQQSLNYFTESQTYSVKLCFITPARLSGSAPALNHALTSVFQQFLQTIGPLNQHSPNLRTVSLHDCYGSYMDFSNSLPFSQILTSLALHHTQKLNISASQRFSPLHVADAVAGILKSSFSAQTRNQHFLILGQETYSSDTLITNLQHQFPHLRHLQLNSASTSSPQVPDHQAASQTYKALHWHPRVTLNTGLQEFLRWANPRLLTTINTEPATASLTSPDKFSQLIFTPIISLFSAITPLFVKLSSLNPKPSPLTPKPYLLPLAYAKLAVIGLILILGIFSLSSATVIFRNNYLLNNTLAQLNSGNWSSAAQQASYLKAHYQKISSLIKPFSFFTYLPALNQAYHFTQSHLQTISLAGKTIESLSLLAVQTSTLGQSILSSTLTTDPRQLASDMDLRLQQALLEASLLQSQLPQTSPRLVKFLSHHSPAELLAQITQTRQGLIRAKHFLQAFIPFLQTTRPQIVAVVFQDSRELRPTGGFITGVLLGTISNGKLQKWQYYDVYEADRRLLGEVAPPPLLKTHLGVNSWYLRDSNWDPDFPTTAKQISWFIHKELEQRPDLVLAVDSNLVINLAQQLSLPPALDFSQTLSEVIKQLALRPQLNWLQLAGILKTGLDQKEILAYSVNPSLQNSVRQFGWSGGVAAPDRARLDDGSADQVLGASSGTFNDDLFIVESNIGSNSVNHHITRSLRHEITVEPTGGLREILHLYYTNPPQVDNSAGQPYKNYLRLYLPLTAQLEEINLHPTDEAQAVQAIPLDTVDQDQEHGYQVFGLPVVIPAGLQQHLQISYRIQGSSSHSGLIDPSSGSGFDNYQLYLRKQPGHSADAYQLQINYPSDWQPTNTSVTPWPLSSVALAKEDHSTLQPSTLTQGTSLTYNITLTQDYLVTVSFNKQKIKSL